MPKKFSQIITRSLLSCLITIFALAPGAAIASADDPAPCVAPDPSSQAGVHRPVGSDAAMYAYDCDSQLWVSSHYTYNPATGATTATDPIIYTYNSQSGAYDTQTWIYNAPQGNYILVNSSVTQPPTGATVVGAPAPATGSSISNTGNSSNNSINNSGNGGGSQSIDNTGANSNNGIDGSNNNNTNSNNNNHLSVNNTITGQANTGNSLVVGNTNAGSATSGNAQDIANVINLLQSSSSALGSGNVVTFVSNIDGDVNGDLLFDPAMLGSVQPASASPTGNDNLTINNSTDASINNDINLGAESGDVTVSQNTTAGDATSGSAQAIANVVNVINSAIGSGKSFIGTININGNFNGDILIPQDLIDQLIASNVPTVTITNTGANSNNTINNNGSSNTDVTNTNNQGITNNVNANADTGNANVSQNTTGGNATSGTANTNITAFNLTGSNVVGANDILVFVNVLGKWVGMIVNAPAGATAAELGGGIVTNTGANSNNAVNNNGSDNTTVNNGVRQTINNNIATNARSGDASVDHNTNGGNAHSGDANSAVNLLNVENSTLSLSNWFGILFINVFGTWNGSFGVNTSAGDPVAAMPGSFNSTNGDAAAANPGSPKIFQFIPNDDATSTGSFKVAPVTPGTPGGDTVDTNNAVLAAQVVKANEAAPTPTLQSPHNSLARTASIIGALVIVFIVSDALYSRRKAHKA